MILKIIHTKVDVLYLLPHLLPSFTHANVDLAFNYFRMINVVAYSGDVLC